MQIAGMMSGSNINQDYMNTMGIEALLPEFGVVLNGLAVTSGSVAAGKAVIKWTRTNGQIVMVSYNNTAAVAVTTSGTTKVWVEVSQAKLDDGSLNAADGTGIATINSGASFPASNYVPLASITAWVITDARALWIKQNTKSVDIASATTTDLATATGDEVHITGTTTIVSFGILPAGTVITTIFEGALLLTYNATSLIIPGSVNMTTGAGDSAIWRSEWSGNWRCVAYQKRNGQAIDSSVNINGLTEDTNPDLAADFIPTYDTSATVNKKVRLSTIRKFGGDGSDGAIGAGTLTITGSNNTYIVKNYTTFAPGASVVTITPTNCILHIKVKNNCDLTNVTFSFSGKGGAAGIGGVTTPTAGTNGSPGLTNILWTNLVGAGVVWTFNGNGGAGGSALLNSSILIPSVIGGKFIPIACGGGGGGGERTSSTNGGAGGAGGGCLILEVGGDIIFTGSVATFTGANGVNGGSGAGGAGGGGGGGGGMFVCLYNGAATGSLTPTVTGGTGGSGGSGATSPSGGGGAGASVIAAGTAWANPSGAGGAGGNGGNGTYVIQKNMDF